VSERDHLAKMLFKEVNTQRKGGLPSLLGLWSL
jgi:hypothetical protein